MVLSDGDASNVDSEVSFEDDDVEDMAVLTTCSPSRNMTRRALGRRRRARGCGTARRCTLEARGNGTRPQT
eukprot:4138643-Prymnesium_polylepis.1